MFDQIKKEYYMKEGSLTEHFSNEDKRREAFSFFKNMFVLLFSVSYTVVVSVVTFIYLGWWAFLALPFILAFSLNLMMDGG